LVAAEQAFAQLDKELADCDRDIARYSFIPPGYHQDYYIKNPIRYSYYRSGYGRDARLAEVWRISR